MKIRSVFLIMAFFSASSAVAFEHSGHRHIAHCTQMHGHTECKLNVTGTINLGKTNGKRNAKNIFLHINDHIGGELRLYQSQDHHSHTIRGEFFLDNYLREKNYIKYHVIFKDKKGIVAQTQGELHIGYGKRQKLRFSTINLHHQDLKDIVSYDIKMTASDHLKLHKH